MSKRKSLNLSEKADLLKDVASGIKKKDIAVKYSISPSTVSTIIKNREGVMKAVQDGLLGRKRTKTCMYEKLDDAVLKWIKIVRSNNLPISGPLIKEKAMDYAKLLGHEGFRASSGWLEKFKKRHGIALFQTKSEGSSVDYFLKVDSDECITEYPTDKSSLGKRETDNEKDVEDDKEEEPLRPSKKEMLTAFDTVRRGLLFCGDVPETVFSCLNVCEHYYEETILQGYVHQDIRNYFE